MHLFTPLIVSLTFLSTTVTAKNCTHDPLTYLNHPLAYLAAHPFLTLKLDELCRDIRHFNHVITDLNITTLAANHPNLDLNATQISSIVSNITAELNILQGNATLVKLCKRAEEVVDDCWPLVYDEWTVNRPECKAAPLANQTAEAGKNSTLVDLCKKFVDGCNKNETVTDAALSAAGVNTTLASTSTSTSTGSSASATATSRGTRAVGMSNGVFVTALVVILGIIMLS